MKKEKRIKKTVKLPEQRQVEVAEIMEKFLSLGLPEDHPAVIDFRKVAHDFEIEGISSSGIIKVFGFQRVLKYIFSKQPHVVSNIVLVHDTNV
jgi:hypothetical protein